MKIHKTVVLPYIPKEIPKDKINLPYVFDQVTKIKELIHWQSLMFRRGNHTDLDKTMDDLLHNLKKKV